MTVHLELTREQALAVLAAMDDADGDPSSVYGEAARDMAEGAYLRVREQVIAAEPDGTALGSALRHVHDVHARYLAQLASRPRSEAALSRIIEEWKVAGERLRREREAVWAATTTPKEGT